MLLITVLVAILSKGLSFEILLIGLLFIGFFAVYRFTNFFFNRFASVRKVIDELSFATTQIKVRIAIAIMLVLVALSEVIGSEIILGAFMAGMIIRLISTPSDAHVEEQLETIGYGFFIPIFFIQVGTGIDIPSMLSSSNIGLLVPLLIFGSNNCKAVARNNFQIGFFMEGNAWSRDSIVFPSIINYCSSCNWR